MTIITSYHHKSSYFFLMYHLLSFMKLDTRVASPLVASREAMPQTVPYRYDLRLIFKLTSSLLS